MKKESVRRSDIKMFEFLKAIKLKTDQDGFFHPSKMQREHHVGGGTIKSLTILGLVERIEYGKARWVGDTPSITTANRVAAKNRGYCIVHKNKIVPKSKESIKPKRSVKTIEINDKVSTFKLSLFWGLLKIG